MHIREDCDSFATNKECMLLAHKNAVETHLLHLVLVEIISSDKKSPCMAMVLMNQTYNSRDKHKKPNNY